MDDDEFSADADFLEALAASETASASRSIIQPTPQRLDKLPVQQSGNNTGPKIVQPTPQALPTRSSGSSILVSTRQKGNPILTHLRSMPWEYSDIPADYVLGLTTCALFLSLKYHRLHPEYIYNRIRGLQGKYNLRIILTMVDIGNHEDSLKELSKTSLINNVTIILCWSAAEAGRYLELYKSFEHANPSAIRTQQSSTYADRMVDFVTVPRSVNKTDAVAIVSAFGSIRAAVNARPDEVAVIGGWGEKKVKRWCDVVGEPFRVRKTAKQGLDHHESTEDGEDTMALSRVPIRETSSAGNGQSLRGRGSNDISQGNTGDEKETEVAKPFELWDPDEDDDEDEEAMIAVGMEEEARFARESRREKDKKDEELSGGIAAALAKLRQD